MPDYIIRGGIAGRERLRLLSRVMRPATLDLLARAGVGTGMTGVDVGCGGGDVSIDLARLVGPAGRVVGIDLDPVKIDIARREAADAGVPNVEFRACHLDEVDGGGGFDFAYGRFVLSHLKDPGAALRKIRTAVRPGGLVVVADTHFRGHFCEPDNAAFRRYVELYTETLRRRGGDANIGSRLPGLLADAGFEHVQMNVAQPAGVEGEVKILSPLTLENIAEAVVAEGVATREETDAVIAELYEFAQMPSTLLSTARVVESWARRPAAG